MAKLTTVSTKVYEFNGVNYLTKGEAQLALAHYEITNITGSSELATELITKLGEKTKREDFIKAIRLLNPVKPIKPRKKVTPTVAATPTVVAPKSAPKSLTKKVL